MNGKTGLLIRKKDIIELASKIEYLILNPDKRKEFGSNGYLKFQQKYTFDIFEENFSRTLDQILSRDIRTRGKRVKNSD